jgi:MFS family permease
MTVRAPAGRLPADYRRLLGANLASMLGTQVSTLAVVLVAVLSLHASAAAVGALEAAQTAGFLLVGIPAGVLADRYPRRDILIVADLGSAAAMATVPLAAAAQVLTLTQLYLVVGLVGALSVCSTVAQQSFVPELVDRPALAVANTRFATVQAVAQVGGPGLAGLLIQVAGPGLAVTADAVSFVISAALVWRIGRRATQRPRGPVRVGAGLGFLFGSRPLRVLTATSAWYNLVASASAVLLILLLAKELRLPGGVIGWFYSLGALGALAGSLVAGRLARAVTTGRMLRLALLATVAGSALVPFADRGARLAVTGAGLLLSGAGVVVYNVAQVTLRQRLTPPELLGRISGSVRLVVTGAVSAGALLAGLLAEAVEIRALLVAFAAAPLLALLNITRVRWPD